ncbi:amidohydrolase family protein [Oscillospiraceae bacterium PP1C4]
MIIDGHAHACGVYSNAYNIKWYLEKKGIDMVVLCAGEPNSGKNYTYPMLSKIFKGQRLAFVFNKIIRTIVKINHSSGYIDEQNEKVSKLQQQMPDKIINTYWANPLEINCIEKMERFYSINGFKMLKLHQSWTPFDIRSSESINIIMWATKKNLPIFIHLYSDEQVSGFVEIANKFMDATFIVGHMIGITSMGDKLKNENVYFDLSAPQLYSESILETAIGKVGYEKLILGSDSPYGIDNIAKNLERLNKLLLPENQMRCICGENLIKILHQNNHKSDPKFSNLVGSQ